MPIKKIVAIGPESTGKSSLCESLAKHYRCEWVPEFARAYLSTHGMDYGFDDLLTIAKGQVELEAKASSFPGLPDPSHRSPSLLFIDTDMYVMKVWCEFVFGKCHQWILDQIVSRTYDLYLLCNTDLPWEEEQLREYPDPAVREKLFHIYKDILVNQDTPWVEIGGQDTARLQIAIDVINARF
jgi:NadR type nicotinamide-nucleotide adenylyltransferase